MLPKPIETRINELRLAINYSRNRKPILNEFDCMLAHREALDLGRDPKHGMQKYCLHQKINLKIQTILGLVEIENYTKQINDY